MKINKGKIVITRFAPSPTGFLHVGGLRTALYGWLFAKKNKGKFILRIEDTDKEREVEGSIEHIKESLNWLGLIWDEGPFKQSERLSIYRKYAQQLVEKGYGYADPYKEEEVETFRKKAEAEKKPFLFRNHRPEKFESWDPDSGKPLRFKVPEIKKYQWQDLVFGDLSAGEEALDDFILIKSDGYPTYNFAHIVDDIEMGVSHVIRGQEFISSMPKFLSLYEALGFNPPFFITLPHILADGGKKKLGKRDGAKDILDYRQEGILPEAMVNFLALLGWHPVGDNEIMSINELINSFEVERIQKSGAQFNEQKLNWMNREYLRKLSPEEQKQYVEKYLPAELKKDKIVSKIIPLIIERIEKGEDIMKMVENGELNYFFKKPNYQKDRLFFKSSKIKTEDLIGYLSKAISMMEIIGEKDFVQEKIKKALWDYAEEVGKGNLLWPIRYALSGQEKSPDPFILAELLGKKETLERINEAISILEKS